MSVTEWVPIDSRCLQTENTEATLDRTDSASQARGMPRACMRMQISDCEGVLVNFR